MNEIPEINEIRQTLKNFFRVNHTNDSFHIDFDSMCVYLLRECRRQFSPSKFETELRSEMRKLKGLPICPELFDELARYVDDMTKYIEQKGLTAADERQEKVNKRLRPV